MSKIDFENVTKSLLDYTQGYFVGYRNWTHKFYYGANSVSRSFKKPYQSYSGFFFGHWNKCYSLDLPDQSMVVVLKIQKEIFHNNIRPSTMKFAVGLHYPNQFLSCFDSLKPEWASPQENETKNFYGMYFNVKIFEVTVLRNTRHHKCNENWKHDDFDVES